MQNGVTHLVDADAGGEEGAVEMTSGYSGEGAIGFACCQNAHIYTALGSLGEG